MNPHISSKKSVYLYDVAGAVFVTFSAPFVSFAWNAIVLVGFLFFVGKLKYLGFKKILGSVLLITLGGGVLDILTYMVPLQVYQDNVSVDLNNFGLFTMILPILSIGIFNYFIARRLFKLDTNYSRYFGLVMGLLTSPWILYYFQYR
ncbi:MAG: hypothetical protein WD187_03375 [Candidatus Woykebacteria bacterium]